MDLNADHLAVAETDASGNYVKAWRVPLVTYGKNTNQAEALIGDAVASVVQYAREVGKPIVIEKLDFRQKKAALEGESRRYSRMLSSFSYGKIKAYFISRGYREGVEVKTGQPGLQFRRGPGEVHGAIRADGAPGSGPWCWPDACSAFPSASRADGFVPSAMAFQVAFTVPVRKRVKHVWTYWGAVSGQLRPALAAQHRLGRPDPVRAVRRVEARGMA